MDQSELGQYTGAETGDDRPVAAEAAAIAGEDGTAGAAVADDNRFEAVEETVEIAVVQVDYTVEGWGDDESPVVHVFGRTEANDLVHARVLDFQPYFYAPAADVTEGRLREYEEITDWEWTDDDGEPYRSIRGDDLVKIVARTPRDVGTIREEFDHYEADIRFPNRFLIDKGVTSGLRLPAREVETDADRRTLRVHHEEAEPADIDADLRVNTFDIEVDDRQGFPEDGEEEIICIASHDSYDDEYVLWLSDAGEGVEPPESLDGYDPIQTDRRREADSPAVALDTDIRVFDSEEAMLDAFLAYIEETDPDLATGWNFTDFDAPYLLDRLEDRDPETEYDLDPDRLSRVDEVWRSNWQGPNVKGRIMFDLLYAYRRTKFTELESYRLENVGQRELGIGKERYAGDIGDLWEEDPERLLEYNLRDVELCVELDREQDIIAFWNEVRQFVGCKLEDATTPGDAVDMFVLHKLHANFVLPSKGQQEGEGYEGGAVFDPITGVRDNVGVLDLKSLYPMCMVTTNASPETKVDPSSYDGETYRAPNGTHFRKEPDGVIREMVDELLAEREERKALRNEHDPKTAAYEQFDRQQQSVKVIMNSLYGVLGWDRFRLYDKEMGAAVTATGREVIEFTEQVTTKLDKEVIYGDSVTGDRPVVVRDAEGSVRIVPIAELFERGSEGGVSRHRLGADGDVIADTTPKEYVALDGWDALSLSGEGEAEWQPIQRVIRHETSKDVLTLQHKLGESTTTRDHAYIVENDGEYCTADPESVDRPVRVPSVPSVEAQHTIDVYEVLNGYEREYEDGRGGTPGETVTKTKRVHADDEHVWFGQEHHGELDTTPKVKRYIDLESEDGHALIELLGAYITEGSVSTAETTDSRYGASFSEERSDWLDAFRDGYVRLFSNVTASVIESDTGDQRTLEYETAGGGAEVVYQDQTHKLQMMNELTAVFFREFAGQTSRGKRIPSFVFHLPEPEQSLFLDTLIEGDGSRKFPRYSDAYAERNFDFETVSRELAAGLAMLLIQRDTKYSLKYRPEKGTYTVRTVDSYRRGRDPIYREVDHDGYVYDLSVAENENFVDGVGGLVLHNTDSVMVSVGDDVLKETAIEQAFDLEEQINDSYDTFAAEELNAAEHRFEIEFEKLYRRFFQAGKKKRYAGHIVWKEGKDVDDIDITGFEYQRSDIAPITKRVQKAVIEMIVTGEDIEEIKSYVTEVIEEFQAGNVDPEDVGIPGGIGKRLDNYDTDTAQVRGAKYANLLLGTNFQRGSKPKRLYLDRVHSDFFERVEAEMGLDPAEDVLYGEFKRDPDVICFEYADQLPGEFEVDWEKMLDKTLKGPIERILEALDVSWEEVKAGQDQTGLGEYM